MKERIENNEMKLLIIFFCFIAVSASAQTTTSGMKWKSAYGINYIYSGEIKNGKPEGTGMAISEDGSVKVFGDFRNGMINGKAVVFYPAGKIVISDWENGWAYGKGLAILPDGTLFYGNYQKGLFEGKLIEIKSNEAINIGDYHEGKFNGRLISVWADGTTVCDNMVKDGIKNGPGYQFEADNQKLYEGIWENGEWKEASTGNYASFMSNKDFWGEANDKHVLIYSALDENKRPNDTCFAYIKESGLKAFGITVEGKFISGIKLVKDSKRTIGEYDENERKQNFCVDYVEGDHLDFGNFYKNLLEGDGIHISLSDGDTMVYYGEFKTGWFTGKGARLTAENVIQTGVFNKGQLTEGKNIFHDASSTGPLEISGSNGEKINLHPKDVCSAVNFLVKEFQNNFDNIRGSPVTVSTNDLFKVNYDSYLKSIYSLPGAMYTRIIPPSLAGLSLDDLSKNRSIGKSQFTAGLSLTNDYATVKKQYDNLCTQISACVITSLQSGKSLKFSGMVTPLVPNPDEGKIASLFRITGNKTYPVVRVMVEKNYNNEYQLTLDVIPDWE